MDTRKLRMWVRVVTFITAALIVLGAYSLVNYSKAQGYKRQLEVTYLRAIEDLTGYVADMDTTLQKSMYAGTPTQLTTLAEKLKQETGGAKSCLAQLPMEYLNLGTTYKFLSQLGDYSVSLAKKVSGGGKLTDAERKTLSQMRGYCDKLNEQLILLQDSVDTGILSFEKVDQNVEAKGAQTAGAPNIGDGFQEFEETLSDYPKLIYDGPFSDHILDRTPQLTADKKEVTRQEARQIAAKAAGVGLDTLRDGSDEAGKMPCYVFTDNNTRTISVTKQGGYVTYLLNSRQVSDARFGNEAAVKKAREYLTRLGIGSMVETYYEVNGGLLTVNFAQSQGDVTIYPDLIKVSVALDTGEVVGYDARGYIVNHHERKLAKPKLTEAQAKKSLSTLLTVEKTSLAIVPTSGQNEVLTYEFKCKGQDGEQLLVYVNAATGAEEQILILVIDENGTLTV